MSELQQDVNMGGGWFGFNVLASQLIERGAYLKNPNNNQVPIRPLIW